MEIIIRDIAQDANLPILIWIYIIFDVLGMAGVMRKMGEPIWVAIIPFYPQYLIFKYCWKAEWYWRYLSYYLFYVATTHLGRYVFALIFGVSVIVCDVVFYIKLAKNFGKGYGFGIGLWLFSPLFYLILGFGPAVYLGDWEENWL